jgi:hypothetical protein
MFMVLSPIFNIFEVLNAIISLGHGVYMSIIKLSEVRIEIRKNLLSSDSYVRLFMF